MESILDGCDFQRYFHCIHFHVGAVVVAALIRAPDRLHSVGWAAMGIEALELLVLLLEGKNLLVSDSKERDRKRLPVMAEVERRVLVPVHMQVLGVQLCMLVQSEPHKNCVILAVDCREQDRGCKPAEQPLEQVVCT